MLDLAAMDFPAAIHEALQRVAFFSESHALKGVLAAQRLRERHPQLRRDFFDDAMGWLGTLASPRVAGLLHRQVHCEQDLSERRERALVSAGVFPMSYLAATRWARRTGLEEMVGYYRRPAVARVGYLGHAFTIWCAFLEALPHIHGEEDTLLFAERFAELVASQLVSNDVVELDGKEPLDGPEIDEGVVLDACLRRPGFYAHALITLAYLHRHRALLSDGEWRYALARVRGMTATTHGEAAMDLAVPAPPSRAPYDETSALDVVVTFLRRGPREVHTLTVADAVPDLWRVAAPAQRAHLLEVLRVLTAWQPERSASGERKLVPTA
ncbi:MAG: hypothetical protein AB2A00_19850 [Myxococcota bacterium]